jgi:adenine/guanine phosphoribosyltransferase-like PRPP-binding protein
MNKRFVAQRLLEKLNNKIQSQLNLNRTVILGVVLKGLPVAYGLAKMNNVVPNFVPLVAQRQLYMQHQIESYFPSLEWKAYLDRLLSASERVLIVDDVVNTGFTRQKVESIVHSIAQKQEGFVPQQFAALILNKKRLASPVFAHPSDIFALEVSASDVECDWGLMTVPLWDLSVEDAIRRCDEYFQKFWINEKRFLTVSY